MYNIEYSAAALKSFLKLPSHVQKQIDKKLNLLAKNPSEGTQVKALQDEKGACRLRVGDYRVVYYVENKKLLILVIRVGHRKDIYQ